MDNKIIKIPKNLFGVVITIFVLLFFPFNGIGYNHSATVFIVKLTFAFPGEK